MTTDTDVKILARTIFGTSSDAVFYDGWRTYGPRWAWRYLIAAIERGSDRISDERPEHGIVQVRPRGVDDCYVGARR